MRRWHIYYNTASSIHNINIVCYNYNNNNNIVL